MKRRIRLQTRLILWVTALLTSVVGMMGFLFYGILVDAVEEQIGKRALSLAKTVAADPELREAFSREEPWRQIQPIAERARINSGAEFVVVGNEHGVRYSHPIPERIGKEMVGGDNGPVLLQGKSFISRAVGSLGPSLRGKTPVFDDEGRVIGIVSVGFMIEDIEKITWGYLERMLMFLFPALGLGVAGAVLLARKIKRDTLGLEPDEISSLYKERNAVLQAVREGIIVMDQKERVRLINQAACDMLSLPSEEPVRGRPIREILPQTRMPEVLRTGETHLNRVMTIRGKELLVNRYPIREKSGKVTGVVASFRLRSEMDELNRQLSQVSRYAEALRAQTHEFKNILYTLSGLIQLGSHREALDLIHRETEEGQDLIRLVVKRIPDPWLGGILLGFYSRARELKVDLVIDPDSRLERLPDHLPRQYLVSILGNLITNAFEAVENKPEGRRKVKLYLGDTGGEILLEVEDSGPGVPADLIPRIFVKGFSTKQGDNRGFGLAKVKEVAEEMGGYLAIERGELGGALFSVTLPNSLKEREGEGNRHDGQGDRSADCGG
ncbi:MAG: sensor histidine kinase [Planifilum fimeticola]